MAFSNSFAAAVKGRPRRRESGPAACIARNELRGGKPHNARRAMTN
jgi:hypothetical protein